MPIDTSCAIHVVENSLTSRLMSSYHVIRHASIATSALIHVTDMSSYDVSGSTARSVTPTRPCRPLTMLTVDFDLLHWPLTKSQKFQNGLSCSVFCVNPDFGLRSSFEAPKSVNCTFFIMVSSKAFFKASPRNLFIVIQSQTFIERLPWVWGRVLEIC